jgi:hypothetical protein
MVMTTQTPFKWRHFEPESILLCIRWLWWLLATSIDTIVHTMSSRVTQVLTGVYLCFKQPNDDKEDNEISVSGVKLLSRSFRHVNAGFLPSKL